jgi:cholesterol oxidase
MDARSERDLRRRNLQAEMIGPEQWRALETWLQDAQTNRPDHPKFIFSGSVLAPVSRDLLAYGSLWKREDGWAGYPATLGRLVAMMVEKRIRNVVFVGGDLHLSAVAHLTLHKRGEAPITAWQIVASGLYAPLPFANARPADFDWNTDCVLPIADGTTSITAHAGLMHAGLPNFVRVDASRADGKWVLTISVNGADGEPMPGSTSPPHHARAEGKSWVISF